MFDEYFANKRKKDQDQKSKEDADKNSSSVPSPASTYKCCVCGKAPLSGPVLYCDGCSQYMCYSCGVASGDMIWDCPNCAIGVQRVVL